MHPVIQKKSCNHDTLLKRKSAASRLNGVQKILLSGNSEDYQESHLFNLPSDFPVLWNRKISELSRNFVC